jgi:hypothetical protein
VTTRRTYAGLALAYLLALTACEVVGVPLYTAGEYRLDAAIGGRLAMVGNCLVLINRRAERIDLAWPSPGTVWDPSSQTITVDGVTATVGDEVILSGGTGFGAGGEDVWMGGPAHSCVSADQWLVGGLELVEH